MSKVSFSKTKGLSALGLLTYFFLFLSVALSFSLFHLLRDTGVGWRGDSDSTYFPVGILPGSL